MPFYPSREARGLMVLAQKALGLTNQGLGDLLGVSMRTVVRWWGGHSAPHADQVAQLAEAVFARDAELAASLAAEAGETLESLGLVRPLAPEPPPPPAPAPVTPSRPLPPTRLLVEAVVGVAADAMHVAPSAVRPAVLAAFSCARGLGLSLQQVEEALCAQVTGRPAEAAGSVAGAVTPAVEPGSSAAR